MTVLILLSDAKMTNLFCRPSPSPSPSLTKARKPLDATHLWSTPTDNLDLETIEAFTEGNEKVVAQNNLFRISQAILKVSLIAGSLSAMLLGLPSVSSNAATPHQWIRVTSDNFNNAWYVDKKIEKRGPYRLYWMKFVHAVIGIDSIKTQEFYYSIDCKPKQRRLRAWINYDNNNKMLDSNYQPSGDVEKLSPKTPNMTIANYVCNHK